jgi:hypothetical protein
VYFLECPFLTTAKRLQRQCFVSGDLAGVAWDGKGEVVGTLCRVVEKTLESDALAVEED